MWWILKYLWIKLYLNIIGTWKSLQEQVWDRHRPFIESGSGQSERVVITGGSHGIGWEAVKALLDRNYYPVIGCRNPEELKKKISAYLLMKQYDKVREYEVFPLDLTSMKSVREFAHNILSMPSKLPIYGLVNNAGIMFGSRTITEDGFESQMAVNHLGHFLLTHLLLPKLKSCGKPNNYSRIINISSAAHYIGSYIDFKDIHGSQFYSPEGAYGNSKAAQILCTYYLNSKLAAEDASITVNCLHPGVVSTGLYQNARYVKFINNLAFSKLMKTPQEGGDSIVHALLSQELEHKGGLYLENSQPRQSSTFTRDLSNQDKMFKLSCDALGIPYDKFGQ